MKKKIKTTLWIIVPITFYLIIVRIVPISPFSVVPFGPAYRPYSEHQLKQTVTSYFSEQNAVLKDIQTTHAHWEGGELPGYKNEETADADFYVNSKNQTSYILEIQEKLKADGYKKTHSMYYEFDEPTGTADAVFEKDWASPTGYYKYYGYVAIKTQGNTVRVKFILSPEKGVSEYKPNVDYSKDDLTPLPSITYFLN